MSGNKDIESTVKWIEENKNNEDFGHPIEVEEKP